MTTAVSAPGKVLLAGGYLVLDRRYTGLVFGLSARINVVVQATDDTDDTDDTGDTDTTENKTIRVDSPQFRDAEWHYSFAATADGVRVAQLASGTAAGANPFVETTLAYALTHVATVAPGTPLAASRIKILADNDYYSQPDADAAGQTKTEPVPTPAPTPTGRFVRFPTTLAGANKTGLGSSAALVTALTAAVLSHYLPASAFDLATDAGRATLHNLAQAAHCAAQGKVGSGFDVAAAVYGSCTYRRFSATVLAGLPETGAPGFAAALAAAMDGTQWDTAIAKDDVALPAGVAMRMCDVTCGSQTVGMVRTVQAWRAAQPDASRALWDALQARNEALAAVLRTGDLAALPAALGDVRALVRAMGEASGAPIEPPSQTALLDAAGAVEGVYGGVVPGAGGFDAVALLVRDDAATTARLEAFLAQWSVQNDARVRLLAVQGAMEGARVEAEDVYEGWL